MALTVAPDVRVAAGGIRLRWLAVPLAVLLVCTLALPMLFAHHANVTSDESLYLAEAYNLAHGRGLAYPSGDAVTHRPPLYPLVLAPAVRLGGTAAAYRVSGAVVALNALLVLLIVWRLSGAIAGAIAGAAASASAYLNGFGTTLYLDPLESTFMLLSLAGLYEATRRPHARWAAASGLMLGLAFLTKESAIQWAPLGVVAWLAIPALRNRTGARLSLIWTLTFVLSISGWWVWVWVQTGELFMLGEVSASSAALLIFALAGLVAFGCAIGAWPRLQESRRARIAPLATAVAGVIVLAWALFMLWGLTRYATWPYPNRYWQSIPHYLNAIAPQAQPYLLLGAAWCIVGMLSWRRADARLISLAALLFTPFALFSANRGLQLRDSLPLVYLSYMALGVAAGSVAGIVRRNIRQPMGDVLLAAALFSFGAAFAFQQAAAFQLTNDDAAALGVRADSWENPFEQHIASWMTANLPPGSRVLSSRLYFSSLYVDTGGRFSIRQMPTVRVDVHPTHDGLLTSRSNLFRWGDGPLRPPAANDQWLYLKQFPGKDYWVGLSQQELLSYIAAHDIDYVVLTGEDAAFSSLSYAGYFTGNAAFSLRFTAPYSASDQLFVFAVDRAKLQARPYSTAIAPASMAALQRETGMDAAQLSAALGSPLRVTDADSGLSDRERAAALAGVDLGATGSR